MTAILPSTMPSRSEVLASIHRLRELLPLVPPVSEFGDDHYAGIVAQIAVLREGLGESGIRERFDDEYALAVALTALRWAEGGSESAPDLDWSTLL